MSIPQCCSVEELNVELEAMQTIARTLANVRDQETRLRILRWTNERFAGTPAGAASGPPQTPGSSLANDPTLSVDGMHLFDEGAAPEPVHESTVMTAAVDQPLDSLLRGFATEFRTLAMQWQSV